MNIEQLIQQKLQEIEQNSDVTILFACESGSRGWGFASPDSDYDVRFIYAPKLEKYLQLETERDVIELPLEGDLDINGWDIRKTLQLFYKSNPTLFEWLQSPIIYKRNEEFHQELLSLMQNYVKPAHCLFHYLSMAGRNYKEYFKDPNKVNLKKYLYVLRPLLACIWIEKRNTMAPMEFHKLLEVLNDQELLKSIDNLLEKKKQASEVDQGQRDPVLDVFIEENIDRFSTKLKGAQDRNDASMEILNQVLRKYVK